MMFCFPQPHKSQLGCNTPNLAALPRCTTLEAVSSCFPAFKPQNHCLPTGNRNWGPIPFQNDPLCLQLQDPKWRQLHESHAFCWQVVLPGNLQWGEEGNSASGTSNTPNWSGGPPKPLQHSNTAAACPAAGMGPCRYPCHTLLPHHDHSSHDP